MKINSVTIYSMESRVKFVSPKIISGVSQQNSIAAFSLTCEEGQDLF